MECLATKKLPEGPDWVYEVKLDGYRAQLVKTRTATYLLSRNGKDLGQRFPELLLTLANAVPDESVLDGELVALDEFGKSNFSLIENSASSGANFVFFAFDLLRLRGEDLTETVLSKRRRLLRDHLGRSDRVQLSEPFQIPAEEMLTLVRTHGLEGVVAKRLSSTYKPGMRAGAWTKTRVESAQELVIAGYTPGTHGFDALLVGFYKNSRLHFCASVRDGFVPASRRSLHARLRPLEVPSCPFVNLPEASAGCWGQGLTAAKMKDCVWLRPEMVGQFKFLEWTPSDHLRHPSFVRLRDDKEAAGVSKEEPVSSPRKPPQQTRLGLQKAGRKVIKV